MCWARHRDGCAIGCRRIIRHRDRLVCIGQKQVWFLLHMKGREEDVRLDLTDHPEFDHWRWVDFWYPVENVVMFKRGVYSRALQHLAPLARGVAGSQAVPPPNRDVRSFSAKRPRRRGAGSAGQASGAGTKPGEGEGR